MVDDNFLLFLFIFVMNTLKQFIMKKPNYFIMGKLLSFLLVLLTVSCNQDLATEEVENTQKPLLEQSVSQKIDAYSPLLNKQDASKVALLFQKDAKGMTRAAKRTISKVIPFYDNVGNALFYAVDFSNNMGYVLVSANKKSTPILAYSDNGSFENAREKMQVWLDELKDNLVCIVSDTTRKFNVDWLKYSGMKEFPKTRTTDNKEKWKAEIIQEYSGKSKSIPLYDYKSYTYEFTTFDCLKKYDPYFNEEDYDDMIKMWHKMGFSNNDILCQVFICQQEDKFGPLLTTHWNQRLPYSGAIEGALGCTTVAMGQFMNYYRLPASKNWDQIGVTGSAAQQQFLKEVGESIGINYSSSERGVEYKEVFSSLKNKYGYLNISMSDEFDDSRMIADKKPVICSGGAHQFLDIFTRDRHMWVIDGADYGRENTYVIMYPPFKQDNVSYEVLPDENPYYPYEISSPLKSTTYAFWHMNWGGSESWNVACDYYWKEAGKNFKWKKHFIYCK